MTLHEQLIKARAEIRYKQAIIEAREIYADCIPQSGFAAFDLSKLEGWKCNYSIPNASSAQICTITNFTVHLPQQEPNARNEA